MALICYEDKKFTPASLKLIESANTIIMEYQLQGFDLTLRQLYYQFVSRDLLPNKQREYKRLGGIVNDARLAGLIDWDAIVDRTRNLRKLAHWESPADIVEACAKQFRVDKWSNQKTRPEVWIEKDALTGVIEGVCNDLDVPYFSCRGYTSQSELWAASQRLLNYCRGGQQPLVIHLGDHDPSGVDMSRDIKDRLELFMRHHNIFYKAKVLRIALNMDQVQQYDPPPNPAKLTDSRAEGYVQEHGDDSWELDALEPKVLVDLIRATIEEHRDEDAWQERVDEENEAKRRLEEVAEELVE